MYESLLTARLEQLLADRSDDTQLIYDIDGGDEPHVLARHVRAAVERALHDEKDPTQRRDMSIESSLNWATRQTYSGPVAASFTSFIDQLDQASNTSSLSDPPLHSPMLLS